MEKDVLSRKDYQTALDIQDACNLSGVVFTFAKIMKRLCNTANLEGHGTDWKNTHPIVQLFCDKLADLAQVRDFTAYIKATGEVEKYLQDHKE